MSGLPERWKIATIGALTSKVGSGSTPRGGSEVYKSSGTPLIRSMNVVFFGFKREGLAYLDDGQAADLAGATVKAGDVLLNITGASIGRVTVAPPDMEGARVNQHVCIVRPNGQISARLLAAYLSSRDVQDRIAGDQYGMTRQALTKQQVLDMPVPVPPHAEQQRIADKLDAILARVDACRDRLDRVGPLLQRFRQSVLDAAVSGRLTDDARNVNAWPSWRETTFDEVALDLRYGTAKKCEYDIGGTAVLRIPNIGADGRVSHNDLKFASFDADEIKKLSLQAGDLLIVRSNGSVDLVGRTAVASADDVGMLFAGYLMRMRVNMEEVLPGFARLAMSCPGQRARIELTAKSTSGVNNINATEIRALPLPLPCIDEQREILRRVSALFAMAERMERRLREVQANALRLTPATLAKAFRGELVPQDPNDEPAAEMLARLATSTPPKKTAKRGRSTA